MSETDNKKDVISDGVGISAAPPTTADPKDKKELEDQQYCARSLFEKVGVGVGIGVLVIYFFIGIGLVIKDEYVCGGSYWHTTPLPAYSISMTVYTKLLYISSFYFLECSLLSLLHIRYFIILHFIVDCKYLHIF